MRKRFRNMLVHTHQNPSAFPFCYLLFANFILRSLSFAQVRPWGATKGVLHVNMLNRWHGRLPGPRMDDRMLQYAVLLACGQFPAIGRVFPGLLILDSHKFISLLNILCRFLCIYQDLVRHLHVLRLAILRGAKAAAFQRYIH